MQKLIFRNLQSPGDIVMLTAAVRDLHRCYPGQFATDVRTPYPQLWEHNPNITPLSEQDPGVRVIDCRYPLVHRCNEIPRHFLDGFIEFLNDTLDLRIRLSAFRGDIHLAPQERYWRSQVHEITGTSVPFWIIVSGGKRDFTIKWWSPGRFQQVVDHFHGKLLFVQVGEEEHVHPQLQGVIDLRGKTDLRQLIRLVHHAQGVVCPVTLLMHLSAAVEPWTRPCVVVAGGREPLHWEAYPTHRFLHTIGALPCCASGGCWKSRTVPLGDFAEHDRPDRLCVDVIRGLPHCMDMITAADVIRAIEIYIQGGLARYLSSEERSAAESA